METEAAASRADEGVLKYVEESDAATTKVYA